MLENIKLLLGITDASKDSLITLLISKSTQQVLSYCNLLELPLTMESIVEELVIIRYNKLGSEGLQAESYSGISQTFLSDIPLDIKTQLNAYRKLKTI